MEGIKILNIMDLVNKADKRWKAQAAHRKQEEDGMKATLEEGLKEEAQLQSELKEALAIAERMEAEYVQLAIAAEAAATERVDKDSLTEADVKAGRITMAEFHARGKTAAQRTELAITQALAEMDTALDAIRSQRKDILSLELKLCKQQQQIFRLSLYPGHALMKALKEQHDFVDRETAALLHERIVSDTNVSLKEHELHLCEGKSLGGGHVWGKLTLPEAHAVAFSPILPKRFIAELKTKLKAFEGTGERINVRLNMGIGGARDPYIEVDAMQTGRVIKTSGKIFEKKGGKIVEREAVEKTTLEKY